MTEKYYECGWELKNGKTITKTILHEEIDMEDCEAKDELSQIAFDKLSKGNRMLASSSEVDSGFVTELGVPNV